MCQGPTAVTAASIVFECAYISVTSPSFELGRESMRSKFRPGYSVGTLQIPETGQYN